MQINSRWQHNASQLLHYEKETSSAPPPVHHWHQPVLHQADRDHGNYGRGTHCRPPEEKVCQKGICKFVIQHDAICKHSKCCPNPSIEIFLMKALCTYVHAVEREISITKNLIVFVISVSNNC